MTSPRVPARSTDSHDALRDAARQGSPTPRAPGILTNGDLSRPMELGDFMNELGVVMQLPSRPTTRAVAAIPEPQTPRRPRARRAVALPALALVLGLAALAGRGGSPPLSAEVPHMLHGEWQTAHASYRARRLSFNGTHLGIALEPLAMPALYRVREVRSKTSHDTTVVVLVYEQEGTLVPFQLQYLAQPQPRLLLQRPADVVWERLPAAPLQTGVPARDSAGGPAPGPTEAPAGAHSIAAPPATGLTTQHDR